MLPLATGLSYELPRLKVCTFELSSYEKHATDCITFSNFRSEYFDFRYFKAPKCELIGCKILFVSYFGLGTYLSAYFFIYVCSYFPGGRAFVFLLRSLQLLSVI